MFVDEIRAAVMAAPRVGLPDVAAVLWRAYGAGHVTEAEAEALSALIEARKALPPPPSPKSGSLALARRGSAPRTPESLERRRQWAASGRVPPALAARYTPGETAALAVVAAEVQAKGDCRLPIGQIAALAGVCATVVRNALREARAHGLVTVEERRLSAWRNHTNVVRIVSDEWVSWLRLARSTPPRGGGCRSAKPTNTQRLYKSGQRPAALSQGLPEGRAAARAVPESRSAEGR